MCRISSLNVVINDYRDLLLCIQKISLNLGLDEYKCVIPGIKATATSLTLPDGLKIQQQVFEAIEVVEDIFLRRGIYPQVSDGTDA